VPSYFLNRRRPRSICCIGSSRRQPPGVNFSKEALDAIHDYTGGIPRLLNIMGNFLLLTAFTEETVR